ncbi:hypothetical protein PG990_012381 [Apiospora arundinis]
MADTFDLTRVPGELRRMIYSYAIANGNGKAICDAHPKMRKEALPMTMEKDEPLRYLIIYIKAFDPNRRDDWLEMEWKTARDEVYSQVFADPDHETTGRLMNVVGRIEELRIVIEPPVADETDLTQVHYLWAKIRDVAFFLSHIKRWDVPCLSISMTSKGPGTFDLTSTPLCRLPVTSKLLVMLDCSYNLLALTHMALLEPLISARKLGSTTLSWYFGFPPDAHSTPPPILGLVQRSASPSASPQQVQPLDLNTYCHQLSLKKMRVETLKVSVALDLDIDAAVGVAANHLRLQRIRTWQKSEQCSLSLESRNKLLPSLQQNRRQLEYLKNLQRPYLEKFDPLARKYSQQALQDKDSHGYSIRLNQRTWANLLPSQPAPAPESTLIDVSTTPTFAPITAVTTYEATVARWTQDKMSRLSGSACMRIECHKPVDKWSWLYPIGVPSLYYLRDCEERNEEMSQGTMEEEECGGEREFETPEELLALGYTKLPALKFTPLDD